MEDLEKELQYIKAVRALSEEELRFAERLYKLLSDLQSLNDKIIGAGRWALAIFFIAVPVALIISREFFSALPDSVIVTLICYIILVAIAWYLGTLICKKIYSKSYDAKLHEFETLYLDIPKEGLSRVLKFIEMTDVVIYAMLIKQISKIPHKTAS